MDIKKRKPSNLSATVGGESSQLKSKDIQGASQIAAKESSGLLGLSANLAALKKPKEVSAKTDEIKADAPTAKTEAMTEKQPSARNQSYLERVKKRVK